MLVANQVNHWWTNLNKFGANPELKFLLWIHPTSTSSVSLQQCWYLSLHPWHEETIYPQHQPFHTKAYDQQTIDHIGTVWAIVSNECAWGSIRDLWWHLRISSLKARLHQSAEQVWEMVLIKWIEIFRWADIRPKCWDSKSSEWAGLWKTTTKQQRLFRRF